MRSRLALLVIIALVVGCYDRSQERAERDLEVGGARVGDVSFRVQSGLATIHRAEPGRLTLWVGAPVVELVIGVSGSAPRSWEIELFNTMADGELEVTRQDDAASRIDERLTPQRSTHRRYRVTLGRGSTVLSFGPDDRHRREPWSFGLLSDIQTGIDDVQDVFARINAEPELRFLLGGGDLSQRGTRAELERFQRELKSLTIPYYTTLGNHDAPPGTPWHDVFGRGSFHFGYRGVRFSMIDSAAASIDPLAYQWLDDWLEASAHQVHVFATHIPALDPVGTRNGAFGSRNEAGKLLQRLAAGEVDLALYGHIHSFYQYENAGIPTFISGGGGAIPERGDGVGRHFMVITVGADAGILSTRLIEVD